MSDQIPTVSPAEPSLLTEQRICPGCKQPVVTENGGVVVAFGQSFFHIDCFRCAKCNNQVTADTNLLLLSDGSPVCADCSYCCNVCGQPILDEAIMTGEDSYHAHCFNCRVCKKRIDELVFAKTSQGIYCMPCHNERVARSRKQHERREKEKRERERKAAAAAAAAGERPGSAGVPSNTDASSGRTVDAARKEPSSAAATPTAISITRNPSLKKGLPSSPAAARSPPSSSEPPRSLTTPLSNVENLAPPPGQAPEKTLQKAKSYDDRQLNAAAQQQQQQNTDPTTSTNGLLVPDNATSRKEKRRSINPGLVMTFNTAPPEQTHNNPFNSAPNTPLHFHMDSAKQDPGHAPSPLREEVPHSLVSSPPSYARDIDRGKPLHISNLARLQSDALQERPVINRSRSASSTEVPTQRSFAGSSPLRSPMRMSFTLDRVPERTTSRLENRGDGFDGGRSTPQLTPNGRDSPSMTRQRSFDSRHRNSSSSLGQDLRSGSISRPTSPAYRADVPHGVESGTDTEAESEDTYVTDNTSVGDTAPPLPPKEAKGPKVGTRPPHLKLDKTNVEEDDHGDFTVIDSEDLSEDFSHEEGALVESTSHSTYIAPALPPIRFSVVGSDFSDLLNTVGGTHDSVKALEAIAARGGKINGVKASDSAPPSQPRTPTSDRTVLGDAVDVTPVPRRVPTANGARKEAGDSQHLTSDTPRRSAENGRPAAEQSILRSVSSPDRGNGVVPAKSTFPLQFRQRDRGASDASLAAPDGLASPAQITVTPPEKSGHMRPEIADIVVRRLSEALQDSRDRGSSHVKMDTELLEAILSLLQQRQEESYDLKHKLDGVKRTSQQAMEGLTVARTQYDKEFKARRDAEAEVARLRVLLSGHAVRLAAASGETIRQEAQKQLSQELSDNLSNLEHSLSQLRLQRDMALAEVEELSASKSTPSVVSDMDGPGRLSRALSVRFDNIKNQYQGELLPLTKEKEAIFREIAELKAMRDAVLAETAAISARNEALAQLNAQYANRADASASDQSHDSDKRDGSFDNATHPFITTSSSATAFSDESTEQRWVKPSKTDIPETQIGNTVRGKFRWPGSKAAPSSGGTKEQYTVPPESKPKHNFQQISVLRVARCDHCGDKMWGSQLRCNVCNVAVHTRCGGLVHLPCTQQNTQEAAMPLAPAGPSLFGRDLVEQVRADSKDEEHVIPVIVEKCIDAVDTLALEYEGIYRKTGGSGQSKSITQLFERGDYASFDLRDSDRFNDICSVTSVLKNYFRSLPNPLLTYDLHEQFIAASTMKDPDAKTAALQDLVTRLPPEHYNTTRALMLHLHRISERSDKNLMHAQNLGVVFGPTLMRSRDPAAEFSDMAGKTLTIKWLVENAPSIFQPSS
ncbi:hypothetical protein BC629DRAFT_1583291 [Irpex lacteus]|nr:hypothetical protein BC629DRAFT_1583291 [Irpex lacteus]